MADGLKIHTHEERRRVIKALTPLIRRHFGDNLVALAVTASFARGDDGAYSDLELTAFVKEMPADGRRGFGIIHDGMLIELVVTTREGWLDTVKRKVGPDWYLAGSDRLQPVLNGDFIRELSAAPTSIALEDCRAELMDRWHEVQEATAKVLTAVERGDTRPLPLLYWDMVLHTLVAIAFLNAKPYTTFARFIDEARAMPIKPAGLDAFLAPLTQAEHAPAELGRIALQIFEEMEQLLYERGVRPYAASLEHLFGPG